MKSLLALVSCVAPMLATAQTSYHPFGHAQQFIVYKPAQLYQCLNDTLTAQPLQLDSGQIVTATAYVNHHWWVLRQYINYAPVEFYVRQKELSLGLYEQPTTSLKHRRRCLLW